MANIGKLNVQIGVDLTKFRSDMNQAFNTLNNSVNDMKNSLKGLGDGFKKLDNIVSLVTKGFAAFTIVNLAKNALYAADSFNQLQGKVKNSLDSVTQFDSTFRDLVASSNRTGTSVDAVAQAFVRLKPVAKDLGANNQQLIQFNETFAKMGVLAGATTEELKQTMVQLSQGLASGTLRGDELRSVLEQMPKLGRAIADSMGIPFSKLKDAAKDGQVTADKVFKAILDKTAEVDKQFGALPGSVERSMNRVSNSLMLAAGEINKASGLTDIFSSALDGLAGFVSKNVQAFVILAGQIMRMGGEILRATGLSIDFSAILNALSRIPVADWAIRFAGSLDLIVTKAQQAGVEVRRLMAGIGNVFAARGSDERFANLQEKTDAKFDKKQKGLDAQWAKREKERAAALKRSLSFVPSSAPQWKMPKLNFGGLGAGRGGGGGRGGRSGGGSAPRGKSEAEKEMDRLKQLAESLHDRNMTLWEKYQEGVKEATKLLKKHLITTEDFSRETQRLQETVSLDFIERPKMKEWGDPKVFTGIEDWFAKLQDAGKDLHESVMTPVEEYKKKISDLDEMLKFGAISQQDFSRAAKEAKDQVISPILTPLEEYKKKLADIQALFDAGIIDQTQFDRQKKDLEDLKNQSSAVFQTIQTVGQAVAGNLDSAFSNFVETGKLNFREFASSVLKDLAQIIFHAAVVAPLSKGISAGVSKMATSFLGFADGGVTPANQPFWVGENGPELMMPNRPMRVLDNQTSMALAGGGGGVTLNQYFTIQTIDNRGFEDRLAEHAKFIGNVSVQAIQRQENRMGRRGPMDTTRG